MTHHVKGTCRTGNQGSARGPGFGAVTLGPYTLSCSTTEEGGGRHVTMHIGSLSSKMHG